MGSAYGVLVRRASGCQQDPLINWMGGKGHNFDPAFRCLVAKVLIANFSFGTLKPGSDDNFSPGTLPLSLAGLDLLILHAGSSS